MADVLDAILSRPAVTAPRRPQQPPNRNTSSSLVNGQKAPNPSSWLLQPLVPPQVRDSSRDSSAKTVSKKPIDKRKAPPVRIQSAQSKAAKKEHLERLRAANRGEVSLQEAASSIRMLQSDSVSSSSSIPLSALTTGHRIKPQGRIPSHSRPLPSRPNPSQQPSAPPRRAPQQTPTSRPPQRPPSAARVAAPRPSPPSQPAYGVAPGRPRRPPQPQRPNLSAQQQRAPQPPNRVGARVPVDTRKQPSAKAANRPPPGPRPRLVGGVPQPLARGHPGATRVQMLPPGGMMGRGRGGARPRMPPGYGGGGFVLDEPDDEDLDFIDDGPDEQDDWRQELRGVTGYDPSRYGAVDADEAVESGAIRMNQEERFSSAVAAREDAEELKRIQMEEEEEKRRKRQRR